jgi:cell division protein FtsI/penicillin-binding protein 2
MVTAGGDWAGAMNLHAGQIAGGVAQHGVEQTRARLRLASIMFVLVFAVLGGRLAQLTLAEDPQLARVGMADQKAEVQRPAITDRNGVVLASQIYLTTLGANAFGNSKWRKSRSAVKRDFAEYKRTTRAASAGGRPPLC